MSDEKAGWEVEGFIDRLTRRNDTNSERLVLEAISHLRGFSRDCDALRESNADLRTRLAQAEAREADEGPGTPMGRLNAIGEFAIDRGLCSGIEAKPPELFILEAFDAARAEADAMREALKRIEHESVDDISRADARAALQAHRPHGEITLSAPTAEQQDYLRSIEQTSDYDPNTIIKGHRPHGEEK